MMDLDKFDWPWPTTLSDEEIEQAIAGLEAAAGVMAARIAGPADNYLAAFTHAAGLFVREYLDNRRADIPGYQQIAIQ